MCRGRGSFGEESGGASGKHRGRPLSGDTKVMQVYAEALVEDLRATIAKSGGDFVELKSRQHQTEGYKKVRVRALLRGRACACDVQQTQETTFAQYNARNCQLRSTAGTLRTHNTREIICCRERRIYVRGMSIA